MDIYIIGKKEQILKCYQEQFIEEDISILNMSDGSTILYVYSLYEPLETEETVAYVESKTKDYGVKFVLDKMHSNWSVPCPELPAMDYYDPKGTFFNDISDLKPCYWTTSDYFSEVLNLMKSYDDNYVLDPERYYHSFDDVRKEVTKEQFDEIKKYRCFRDWAMSKLHTNYFKEIINRLSGSSFAHSRYYFDKEGHYIGPKQV